MSRDSSNKFLEIINAEQPDDIFIHLVTIFWNDGSIDRYAKNYEPVTSRNNTYQAAAFSINLPEEPTDSVPTLQANFALDNTGLVKKLIESTEPPSARFEIVLNSDTDIVEVGPFDFDIRNFQMQGTSVSIELGFEPILDLSIPQISYTSFLFPGLFKDAKPD